MSTYTARAVRWSGGWELHVDGVGVTQVRTLDRAEQQIRDLVETMTGADAGGAEVVVVVPGLDRFRRRLAAAQRKAARAAEAQLEAAAEIRAVVEDLRSREHLSVSDTATVLGVSRGRVSQLTKV